MTNNNTTRALKQAVSIDGWIGEFGDDSLAGVHVDVVFRQGVFGDRPEDRIRFKIALRRAEIVVRIPDHEPLSIVKKTVRRTAVSATGQRTTRVSTEKSLKGKIEANLSRNPTASLGGEASHQKQVQDTTELAEQIAGHLEQHFSTPDGHHAWEIAGAPDTRPHLEGAPWDAAVCPVAQVKRSAERNAQGERPTIMIEVRCRREDIEIIDLEEKDPEGRSFFSQRRNKDKVLAAAEQVIRSELERVGFLDIPDLSEQHARLLIADRIVYEDE